MEIDLFCLLFDQLIVTEVSSLPSKDEDLLCCLFSCLSISGDGTLLPTSYNSYPVGHQVELNISKISDLGLHGSSLSAWDKGLFVGRGLSETFFPTWAKGSAMPWCNFYAHVRIKVYSGGLLFLGRQLQRDFYLFFTYFGVTQKNVWLAFGYLKDAQSFSDGLFNILWRYITVGLMQRRPQCILLSKQVSASVLLSASWSRYFSASAVGFSLFHVCLVMFPCSLGLVGSVNGYPNFDLFCPGRWKLSYGLSGEFIFHMPCGRNGSILVSWHLSLWRRVQSDYLKEKNFNRVVDHATSIQTHPYVCGASLLVLLSCSFNSVSLVPKSSDSLAMYFLFSQYCLSWGEMELSSMLDSFPHNDGTSY